MAVEEKTAVEGRSVDPKATLSPTANSETTSEASKVVGLPPVFAVVKGGRRISCSEAEESAKSMSDPFLSVMLENLVMSDFTRSEGAETPENMSESDDKDHSANMSMSDDDGPICKTSMSALRSSGPASPTSADLINGIVGDIHGASKVVLSALDRWPTDASNESSRDEENDASSSPSPLETLEMFPSSEKLTSGHSPASPSL